MRIKPSAVFLILLAIVPLSAQNGEFLIDTNVVFSPYANAQLFPAVAFDGNNYLVLWQDNRGDTGDIYAARVDPAGFVLDPAAFAVSIELDLQSCPRITFDCGNYFAVWCDHSGYGNIYGARITPEGSVLDTLGIRISQDWGNDEPVVTSDGVNYFASWTQYLLYHGSVHGARVNESGVVLDIPSILIQSADINLSAVTPTVSFGTSHYLVVFSCHAEHIGKIVGKRVNQSGIIIDTNWINIVPSSYHYEWAPAVVYDGSNYLIVWEDQSIISSDKNIYGARVLPSGVVLDSSGFSICSAQENQTNPCIAFNGTDYTVIWEDWRNGVESDIYGAKINTSGTVVDSFVVSNAPGNQLSPAITHGPGNQMLITYSRWTDSINGQPVNAMRIWGRFYPELGITEHDDQTVTNPFFRVSPSPFTEKTSIRYSIPYGVESRQKIEVSMKIYDATGRLVRSYNQESSIENQESVLVWHGDDNAGRKLPSGVYFVKFVLGDYEDTEKVLLVR